MRIGREDRSVADHSGSLVTQLGGGWALFTFQPLSSHQHRSVPHDRRLWRADLFRFIFLYAVVS
jgi:hypothetical protein